MKHCTTHLALMLAIVLLLPIFSITAFAADDTVQPYVSITECPSCGASDLRDRGNVRLMHKGTPTQCVLHEGIVGNHMHEFCEDCHLYYCGTCGYEEKFNSVEWEYCPVAQVQIGYALR